MQKSQIMFLCGIATIMFGACTPTGYCPSDWYCATWFECPDGRTVYECVSLSGTSGGYKVGNTCYLCEDFYNIDNSGCDSAAAKAINDCYSYNASATDSISPLRGNAIDQYTDSENSEATSMDIDEKLIKLKEIIEHFKR
jgi:hypothetical protein